MDSSICVISLTKILKNESATDRRDQLPIPRNDFNKGITVTSLQDQILDFLSKHRDNAYTTVEIVREMIQPDEGTIDDILRLGGWVTWASACLDILMKEKKVVGKTVS